jgi:Ca2+-binding RTX toxin-like protein
MIQFSSLSLGATYDFALATDVNDSVDFSLIDAGQLGQLQQSPGIDAIVLQGGNDTALDTDEGRYFFGNAGNDSIDLQGGNDFGSGGRDSDTLTGGNGDDSLFGNLGDDQGYFILKRRCNVSRPYLQYRSA